MDQFADLAADGLLPLGQRVDVVIDARIGFEGRQLFAPYAGLTGTTISACNSAAVSARL